MPRRRRRKRQRARCIRSYRRLAQQDHGVCKFCRGRIMTGDEYEGSVYVNGVEFWVVEEHMYCLPWDEDENRDREEDETSEKEDLKEAA